MSTPSSVSLSQNSSKSTKLSVSSSSRRSSLLNTVVDAFNIKKKKRTLVDASVVDSSHGNTTYNHGQMNVAYGNNVIQNITVGIDPLDALILGMTRSLNAEFDVTWQAQRESCAPQTRQYVLKLLKAWCKERTNLFLYWLSGMPGTGKTTIVYTLCQYLRKRGLLGASFFCSRSVADCQEIQLIFPTIAFQLARNYPVFGKQLAEILRKDPDIPRRELSTQLQRLIIDPFKEKEDELPSNVVVVLDALDECHTGQSIFLRTLVSYTHQLPFRLILTSRPDYVIYDALPNKDPTPTVQKFILHEVEKDLVREDIIKYLRHALSSANPPISTAIIDALADHSGSSFIIAATTVRLVMDGTGDPAERLEAVLKSLVSSSTSALSASLDKLYTDILSRITSVHGAFQNEIEDIKDILFTIVCVREPLTRQAIATLWGLDEVVVNRRLRLLRSIICVLEDATKPVTTFHASFPEFITDEKRSGSFYCDATAFHGRIAAACFKTMSNHLRQNICKVDGNLPNGEIEQAIIDAHIDAGLAYALVHWGHHVQSSDPAKCSDVAEESQTFCSNHLFHWLECLSLLHHLPIYEKSLGSLRIYVLDEKTLDLVEETCRFTTLNYDIINHSAMETYFSALVWVPSTSSLRAQYAHLWRQQSLPQALRGLSSNWKEASQSVKIHGGMVKSVVVTTDGKQVVSGSDDQTVRIWDVASRREGRAFVGHQQEVRSVTVSADNTRIFSGSSDRTVRVWDMASAQPSLVFQRHSEPVLCVAISRDAKLVCSCDLGNNLLVWNAETAEVVCSMKSIGTRKGGTRCAQFTSDDSHVIFASQDVVHIYSLQSKTTIRTLRGHDSVIQCVAVSPQGTQLVTGSSDKTAKIWNFSTGKKVRTLRGHTGGVQSAVFCHDGQRVVSGSEDKTIRVWSARSGDTMSILTGHSQIVWTVAVFPDDLHMISGSADDTMLVWDIPKSVEGQIRRKLWSKTITVQSTIKSGNPWDGTFLASSPTLLCLLVDKNAHILDSSDLRVKAIIPIGNATCAAFSYQGVHLAAGLKHTMSIWDVTTAKKLLTMKARKQEFLCVAFSHNGSQIVTGSNDRLIRVWDAVNGVEQLVFQQPGGSVRHVAFSLDDRKVVSTSMNKRACVWNIDTERLERIIETEVSHALTFLSADGEYLFQCTERTTFVWNVHTGEYICSHDGHTCWTSLPNGVSYSILKSSWICRTTDLTRTPTKLCWIPPKYRNTTSAKRWEPIAFPSASGNRVFLSNINDTVVLDIPAP